MNPPVFSCFRVFSCLETAVFSCFRVLAPPLKTHGGGQIAREPARSVSRDSAEPVCGPDRRSDTSNASRVAELQHPSAREFWTAAQSMRGMVQDERGNDPIAVVQWDGAARAGILAAACDEHVLRLGSDLDELVERESARSGA